MTYKKNSFAVYITKTILLLCLSCCATERISEQNLSISLPPNPLYDGNSAKPEANQRTIARLGQTSALPTSIAANPEDFNYETTFGAISETTVADLSWLDNHAEALQLAKSTSKPLLVWFSNAMYSPTDRQLSAEVLSHQDFLQAASGRVIRVQLDYSDRSRARSEYYTNLKNHYGARGYPFVAIALPDGTIINEFSGYRSKYQAGYLDNFARSIDDAIEQIEDRREHLINNEGYRWWTGKNQRRLFASALAYDEASSRVALQGMWQEQWIIHVTELSDRDQLYLTRWLSNENAE